MNTNPTRVFQLSALAIAAFAAAMTVKAPEANAIVYCVEGVYRAGSTSYCLAALTTASASTGSGTTAAAKPTLASWHRKCRQSCQRR